MENTTSQQQPQVTQTVVNSNSGGFSEQNFEQNKVGFGNKFQQFWQAVRYYTWQIWPYFQQLINFLIYTTIKVIRAIVKIALSQTGLIKNN